MTTTDPRPSPPTAAPTQGRPDLRARHGARRRPRPVWVRVVNVVGELLVTLGVVVLLFVGYQLVWTNVMAERAATAQSDALHDTWRSPGNTRFTGSGIPKPLTTGKPFAMLRIPRLGLTWSVPIVQGVRLSDLAKGVGHYPRSALPGEVGNFAVAGHRATNGEPFAHLDTVVRGDAVIVETRTRWFVYRVTGTSIVEPTDVGVVLPVPNDPGATPTRRLVTLTTCNPRWASYQRLIVHGVLSASTPKSAGLPSALQGGA